MTATRYNELGNAILNDMEEVTVRFRLFVDLLLGDKELTDMEKEYIAIPLLLRIRKMQELLNRGE